MDKVAVVDSDPDAVEAWAICVRAAKMEPIPLMTGFRNLESAADKINHMTDAALCGHRLFLNRYANFSGAHLVACLYRKSLPAILVTPILDVASDVSIRKYREWIPVLLTRDNVQAAAIRKGLAICQDELSGRLLPSRKRWRTIVRIEAVDQEGTEDIVSAVVVGWNPHERIRFPADLMPPEMRQSMFRQLPHDDFYVLAQVNIGAETSGELYLRDFELTLPPNPRDGLA